MCSGISGLYLSIFHFTFVFVVPFLQAKRDPRVTNVHLLTQKNCPCSLIIRLQLDNNKHSLCFLSFYLSICNFIFHPHFTPALFIVAFHCKKLIWKVSLQIRSLGLELLFEAKVTDFHCSTVLRRLRLSFMYISWIAQTGLRFLNIMIHPTLLSTLFCNGKMFHLLPYSQWPLLLVSLFPISCHFFDDTGSKWKNCKPKFYLKHRKNFKVCWFFSSFIFTAKWDVRQTYKHNTLVQLCFVSWCLYWNKTNKKE